MNHSDELILRISPASAEAIVEQTVNGIVSRKTITTDSLAQCFLQSRYDDECHETGLLPEGCIGVSMLPKYTYYFIRYPELCADFTYYESEYPNFPIPRLVFAFKYLNREHKIADSSVCVVKDERLTPDTPLFHYPFSNVYTSDKICTGNNALPIYKDPARLHTLAGHLLRMPNNDDLYNANHNRLNLGYRDLLEQMKGQIPSVYYTDILVPNGRTLKDFMNRR